MSWFDIKELTLFIFY